MIIVSDPNIMGKNCVHRAWMCLFAVLSLSLVAQAQPAVERITDGDIVYLDREWRLVWEVRWHGAADAYMILPPEIEEMDWAAVAPGPSESFVRDGENVVLQSILVTPRELGSFEVPGIEIGYLSPGDLEAAKRPEEISETQEPEREIPKLRLNGFSVEVRKDRTVLWAALAVIGAGAFLYLGGMGLLLLRHVQKSRPDSGSDVQTAESEARPADMRLAGLALHEAKRCRVEGNTYAFYANLAKTAEMLGSEHRALAGVLQARAQKVGFSGYTPTEDEMETDYRAIARVLKQTIHEDEAPAS